MNLSTERLRLRAWDPDDPGDVEVAFDIYGRTEVVRWLGGTGEPWGSREETRERLARWSGIELEQPGYGLWAVQPHALQHPVGTVLLLRLADGEGTPTDDVEVGWHFHPDHWGNGYATEASRAVLAHAFSELHLERVNAIAYSGNDPSFAVMRRLGMTHRGTTDRWYGATFEWWVIDRDEFDAP